MQQPVHLQQRFAMQHDLRALGLDPRRILLLGKSKQSIVFEELWATAPGSKSVVGDVLRGPPPRLMVLPSLKNQEKGQPVLRRTMTISTTLAPTPVWTLSQTLSLDTTTMTMRIMHMCPSSSYGPHDGMNHRRMHLARDVVRIEAQVLHARHDRLGGIQRRQSVEERLHRARQRVVYRVDRA